MIFNLSLWFALHALFGRIGEARAFGARILVPAWSTFDGFGLGIALASFAALWRLRWRIPAVVAAAALAGLAARMLGG